MGVNRLLRRLGRSPLFTVMTLVTLAIGIGATTAIFSVLDGVLLKPLPYPHAEQLIFIDHRAPGVDILHAWTAPFLYFIYREQNRTLRCCAPGSHRNAQGVRQALNVNPAVSRAQGTRKRARGGVQGETAQFPGTSGRGHA